MLTVNCFYNSYVFVFKDYGLCEFGQRLGRHLRKHFDLRFRDVVVLYGKFDDVRFLAFIATFFTGVDAAERTNTYEITKNNNK
jgi:hypothetical protein